MGHMNPAGPSPRRERLALISAGRTALQGNDDFLAGKVERQRWPQTARDRNPPG